MKIYPRRIEEGGNSEVVLSSKAAKHYHMFKNFSQIPRAAIKRAILRRKNVVMGFLGKDNYSNKTSYFFDIKYLPKGEVEIGCLRLSRGQFRRLKEWALGGGK